MTDTAKPLSPEALEFAPGLLAIQESPPAKLPRTVSYAVIALFTILLVWAFFGKLDIIASAEGKLVPQSYVKIVQPSDAGIVQEILVEEGESVKAGQVLMRMDTKLAQADMKSVEGEFALRNLQLDRIDAELSGKPLVKRSDAPADLFGKIESQYRDHRQSYQDGLAGAKAALDRARREYESGKEELEKLREITPILKEQADAYAESGKEGYVPRVTVREKEREYREKARDLAAQEERVASFLAAVTQAEKQVHQIASKYRSDLQNERVETEGQYRKLEQELAKQSHKMGLLELRAPTDGVVKDIATHTIGTVVSPGTVLLSLVPEKEALVAEVMVKNEDVGFVYPKQKVKVKLSPYPFEKYGMLDGEVIQIGPDANEGNGRDQTGQDANKDKQAALSYKAIISLDRQLLEAQGKTFKILPGMQVVTEINQGRRTVMEYLLSPVSKALYNSGRER